MIYAIIENSTLRCWDGNQDGFSVDDLPQNAQQFDVPSHEWLQIDNGEIVVVDPSPLFLEREKEKKQAEINRSFSAEFSKIKEKYPEEERETWSQQREDAAAYNDDPTNNTPFLDALAQNMGVSRSDLAARITAKVQEFRIMSANAVAKRQILEEQLKNASTIDEVNTISW